MVSGGGTFGAAATSYGSSGRVARSVVDGGGTFGAAAVITRRCVYKIIFRGVGSFIRGEFICSRPGTKVGA